MKFANRTLPLDCPSVMGILNVTPDSFYDGGQLFVGHKANLDACLRKADAMVMAGAVFIDIGGESTRPDAAFVSEQEEIDRVLPVIEAINASIDCIVSVDTSSPALMCHAAQAGAGLINDVRALSRDGALAAAASSGLPVCLMHMLGDPKTMQLAPSYTGVVAEVSRYLSERVEACLRAGFSREQIILDPGIGFGKTDEHNLKLLRSIPELLVLGFPLLIGVSRKSMIGRLLGRDVHQRLAASLAFAYAAAERGAQILRVHDVAETADVLSILNLMNQKEG